MREIRLHGRFGQPVGSLAGALGKYALKQGKHVQIFSCFAAFRPGGPMDVVIRTDDQPIRERSANSTNPDIVVVLDNSLFSSVDITKGLKTGGTVMALGVDSSILGPKAGDFNFVALDQYIAGNSMHDIETGLILSLESRQLF
ncbi:MAG: 2-oxoacid:acceptor oxidoreductase family protein [Negativicutes bacterium]|nr:2-oxoacid:acceptor oxidoreductase family protein [Negativicutes bacterium]